MSAETSPTRAALEAAARILYPADPHKRARDAAEDPDNEPALVETALALDAHAASVLRGMADAAYDRSVRSRQWAAHAGLGSIQVTGHIHAAEAELRTSELLRAAADRIERGEQP